MHRAVAERVEIRPEDQEQPEPAPKPKLSESEARRLLLLRVALGFICLVVLVWLVVRIAGRIGTFREAARIYQQLHKETPATQGVESQIRALGSALNRSQLRTLAAGRSLDYDGLTLTQQALFSVIRPLPGPNAPTVKPYQVRLDKVGKGRHELRLIWAVPGAGQAVSESLRLE